VVTGLLPHLDDIASEIAERMRPGSSDKRAILERPHLPECACSLLPGACPTGASLRIDVGLPATNFDRSRLVTGCGP